MIPVLNRSFKKPVATHGKAYPHSFRFKYQLPMQVILVGRFQFTGAKFPQACTSVMYNLYDTA